MTTDSVVIVGAGLTGATAAQSLRQEGFDGQITLIGAEPHLPYERPGLSKDYLQGSSDRDALLVHPTTWYAEHDVDLRLGTRATAVDRPGRVVRTDDGERLRYDRLLLATGSTPRLLSLPGADLAGVHYLRLVEDCDRLRAALAEARRVAIIGGGWIGLEVASAARAAGVEVTVLETAALPLLRVLGPEVAPVFADLHREHGVDLRARVGVRELTGDRGTVTGVLLEDGEHVPADLVVVGIGITPVTDLAEAAGLTVDDGIVVDEHLRTADPLVYAAGDVANAVHPRLGRRLRVEHWANALRQGERVGQTMLGQDVRDERSPYFYTDQYDLGMEYTGYVEPGGYDRVVFRGDVAAREFIVFWLRDGRVLAGMNVNIWDVADQIEEVIRSGAVVDPDQLADPDVPLPELVRGSAGPDVRPPIAGAATGV